MDLVFQAIVIGIVQGLTEFLPISSSAHLILIPAAAGLGRPVHQQRGLRRDAPHGHAGGAGRLLLARPVALFRRRRRVDPRPPLGDDPNRRLAWLLLQSASSRPRCSASCSRASSTRFSARRRFYVCGLLRHRRGHPVHRRARRRHVEKIGSDLASDALRIGVAQALALFPGISRSGITIAAGLFRGLERAAAARFAFLMGIPVIGGAGIWKLREMAGGGAGGFDRRRCSRAASSPPVSGLLAICFLLRYLQNHNTDIFVVYRSAAAIVFAPCASALIARSRRQSGEHGSHEAAAAAADPRPARVAPSARSTSSPPRCASAASARPRRRSAATCASWAWSRSDREGEHGYAVPAARRPAQDERRGAAGDVLHDLPIEIKQPA